MKHMAIVAGLLLIMAGVAGAQPSVVINEVDCDTAGTDALEFIELFGAPGLSLDGMVLVFWNGSTNVSYAAFDLDGYSLDGNGFFLLGNAAVVPTPSIIFAGNFLQNGQDAVALYQGNDTDFPNGTALTSAGLVDALVYDTDDADDPELLAALTPGQPQINEDGMGNKDYDSNQRCPDGGGGALVTTQYYQFFGTPGTTNDPVCAAVGAEDRDWGSVKSLYR